MQFVKLNISQVTQSMFVIIILSYNHKTIVEKLIFSLKKNLDRSIKKYKAR